MTTPKLQMPELVVGQAGKELTHNQALAVLDQLAQAVVVDKDLTAPPGSPANGSMYIAAAGATGAWAGQDGKLAYWLATVAAWTFITPTDGWSIWVADESKRYERRSGSWAVSSGRELLYSPRTYYVRTDGSDSNAGLVNTAGGAFLTIQKAVDAVSSVDTGIYDVTIKIADGSYNVGSGIKLKSITGSGTCSIVGNTSNNLLVSVSTSGTVTNLTGCFYASGISGSWIISDVALSSVASGQQVGILSSSGSNIEYSNISFGSGFAFHIRASDSGFALCRSSYSITAPVAQHLLAGSGGVLRFQSATVTISELVSFATAFAVANTSGTIVYSSSVFIGSATGKRFNSDLNGVINTNGSGLNFLPGDLAGTTDTGGQYA